MKYIVRIAEAVLIAIFANIFLIGNIIPVSRIIWLSMVLLLMTLFVVVNIVPCYASWKLKSPRLRNNADGCELLEIFLISAGISIVINVYWWFLVLPAESPWVWTACVGSAICCMMVEAVVFWNGMIRIYITSVQLGMKWRIIGALCGMIPVVHLIVLGIMIGIVREEIRVENDKLLLDQGRAARRICRTKYPLLLVHGVFFRDSGNFNYWGRIPAELEANGATLYYGNHGSAASVADSARELDARIRQIVRETGCGKVNIIAHSKGGLDSRAAIAHCGMAPYVATLTTINTPHRGCIFAEYLLGKVPEAVRQKVAAAYNATLRKVGDPNPDFLAAVTDLTESACLARNEVTLDVPGVVYESVMSYCRKAQHGKFPLNMTYPIVKHFDGLNDGLVSVESAKWGEKFTLLEPKGKRGISHGDVVDLNRENIRGFDVREFYVKLVADLKRRGY